MIKHLKAYVVVLLVAVGVTACVVGDEEPTTDPQESAEVGDAEPADAGGEAVTVPDELSFEQLSAQSGGIDAADVGRCARLEYCRDRRHNNRPTYCRKRGCSADEAFLDAYVLCRNTCGDVLCNVKSLGRC